MASTKHATPVAVDEVTNRIAARVEELKVARQTYLEQAQRQMAAYDAAIGELEAMLKPPEPPPPAENGAAPPEQLALALPVATA